MKLYTTASHHNIYMRNNRCTTGTRLAFSLFCMLFAITGHALEQDKAKGLLTSLFQIKVQSYLAINTYYNFSANRGDRLLQSEISDATDEIDALIKGLNAATAEDTKDSTKIVSDNWTKYKKLIKTNVKDIIKQGYPDLRMVDDMSKQNIEFISSIDQATEEFENVSGYKPKASTLKARLAALGIAQMMTRYSARSTSSISQVFQGSGDEKTIDQLAKDFDTSLSKLAVFGKTNNHIKSLLNSIETKWSFIRGSYINYDKKNVNYIANLYSKKIIANLVDLSDLTDSQK